MKENKKETWHGTISECDICHNKIENQFVDGRTSFSSWAIMCPTCYERFGVGTGIGKGQMYELNTETNEFIKVADEETNKYDYLL